ncbi:MAG: tetratricopeptide repeat protein [Myxococcales bacterium]|nr:tetratricopeptide repeat protein [Myxococcales bacterium]
MAPTAADWMDRCVEALQADRPAEALECLDGAIACDPTFVPAWGARGSLLSQLERPAEALVCFERVLELEPGRAGGWFGRGNVLQALGRLDDALASFRRASELDPAHVGALVNAGRLLDDRGEPAPAVACYDRALALDPDEEITWTNKGNSLVSLGREEEALACYARALELEPRSPAAWQGRVWALSSLGRIDEANDARPIGAPFDRGRLRLLRADAHGRAIVVQWFEGRHTHPELLEGAAHALLDWLRDLARREPSLGPGAELTFGAMPLGLRARGDDLVVCMPDLERPRGTVLDVTFALQTTVLEMATAELVSFAPESWLLTDTLDVVARALEAPAVRLHRARPSASGDSGWQLLPLGVGADGASVRVPLAEVAQLRPHLLKVLSLPVGWSAELQDHRVTSVRDAEGHERLDARP